MVAAPDAPGEGHQLPARRGVDEHGIEEAVGRVGVWRHVHAAAFVAAERELDRLHRPRLLAAALGVPAQLEAAVAPVDDGQQRRRGVEVGAQARREACRALGDEGREADPRAVDEVAGLPLAIEGARPVGHRGIGDRWLRRRSTGHQGRDAIRRLADVHAASGRRVAGDHRREPIGQDGRVARDVQAAGVVAASTGRHQAQHGQIVGRARRAGAVVVQQPVDDLVERPVATDGEDERRARIGGRVGEVGGLQGPRGEPHVVAHLPRRRARPPSPARPARRRPDRLPGGR